MIYYFQVVFGGRYWILSNKYFRQSNTLPSNLRNIIKEHINNSLRNTLAESTCCFLYQQSIIGACSDSLVTFHIWIGYTPAIQVSSMYYIKLSIWNDFSCFETLPCKSNKFNGTKAWAMYFWINLFTFSSSW